jgi:Fur family ferric uptake transcriptional regulator
LRSKGLRITPIVTTLLSRLAGSHQVRTASELKDEISAALGYDVGSPTVYRICERLALTGVLCSMHKNDGILRYFLCADPQNEKHQHFICTRCMKVQEVDCTIDKTIWEAISERIDGEIERNFIQLEGVCGDCRK